MTEVLDENKIIHQPFNFGRVDEYTALQCTLSLVFYSTKVVYTVDNLQGSSVAYGLVNFNSADLGPDSGLQLEEILPLYKFKYRKVWVAISNHQYCLIPADLHKRQHNDGYLSAALGINAATFSLIKQDTLFTSNEVMVYNISAAMDRMLSQRHTGISIRHEKTVVAGRVPQLAKEFNKLMLINLCEEHFDLILIKDGKLIFLNSFPMNNTEEVLYYIMDVFKQLELNPGDFTGKMIGLKPLYFNRELLKKYFHGIKEYTFKDGEIYNDQGLYFTPHFLTR